MYIFESVPHEILYLYRKKTLVQMVSVVTSQSFVISWNKCIAMEYVSKKTLWCFLATIVIYLEARNI